MLAHGAEPCFVLLLTKVGGLRIEIRPMHIEYMMTQKNVKPFDFKFLDNSPRVLLELTNTSGVTLKSIEILTVFLKDETISGGGPSHVHIRFDPIKSVQPNEKAIISHKTWIDGRPATDDEDQLGRLRVVSGALKPYVLDISWEDVDGKTQFQRIPVGS